MTEPATDSQSAAHTLPSVTSPVESEESLRSAQVEQPAAGTTAVGDSQPAPRHVVMYLPVIHAGYEKFLNPYRGEPIFLLGKSITDAYKPLAKEIRALNPQRAAQYLTAAGYGSQVLVTETDTLDQAFAAPHLVMPDEDILRQLVAGHDLEQTHEIHWQRTFLRWDRDWSQAGRPAGYDGLVSTAQYDRDMQALAGQEAQRSSDWWRQVGAVASRDGKILDVAHNAHQPHEYAPYLAGDPRNNFSRGNHMELTTALHAEAAIIARAAQRGISLAGADIHVTTFPCPTCAALIAAAGFARCYFAGPYSLLDGGATMQAAGVELYFVTDNENQSG